MGQHSREKERERERERERGRERGARDGASSSLVFWKIQHLESVRIREGMLDMQRHTNNAVEMAASPLVEKCPTVIS